MASTVNLVHLMITDSENNVAVHLSCVTNRYFMCNMISALEEWDHNPWLSSYFVSLLHFRIMCVGTLHFCA